jgi:hypothetical protein
MKSEHKVSLVLLGVFVIGLSAGLLFFQEKPVNAQLAAASGFNYSHITTATNTLAKAANGTLHNLTVNTTAAAAITLFDSSAANCTGGTTIAVLPASAVVGDYNYDLQFLNGLCITTAGTPDITVTWR